jgi:hypothetical protein
MTAQRPESPADATFFCGPTYPSAAAAVAARTGMKHPPAGLRVKHCEVCRQFHLRARNNLRGKHRGRLPGLPAGPEAARHDRVNTGEQAGGKGDARLRLAGSAGAGRPQGDVRGNGEEA